VPEEPGLADVIAEQGELLARLRAVVEAKDAENQVLRAAGAASAALAARWLRPAPTLPTGPATNTPAAEPALTTATVNE
jgi:hypothetical protein